MESYTTWGLNLIGAFQEAARWLTSPMLFFSFLGREEFYLICLPLIFWCIDKALGKSLVILLIASNVVNGVAKAMFKLPRPPWFEPGLELTHEDSFGLPSGHSTNGVVLWGYLATLSARPWRWLMVIIILLISLSRIFLGVHFPGDVLGGWILGALVLWCFCSARTRLAPWFAGRSMRAHLLLAIAASGLTFLLFESAIALPSDSQAVYGHFAETAIATAREAAGTLSGMVLGLWVGLVGEERFVRFSVKGAPWRRALRYVVGMVGVVALWYGLKLILPTEPLPLGVAMRILRYAAMLAWTAWFWPWMFIRLRLGYAMPKTAGAAG